VSAALAVSRRVEDRTGWSIRKFVRAARRYRPSKSGRALTSSPPADPIPRDLQQVLTKIHNANRVAH